MDLTNLQTIKSILKENHLWAKHRLGQNFLVAKPPLITLIEAADLTDKDVVIEIGPGLGTLTQELAKKAKLVLAIEKDPQLAKWLRTYFKNYENIKIIHDDILRFPISNFHPSTPLGVKFLISNQFPNVQLPISKPASKPDNYLSNYKVISNLPYNITSPVIRKFLEADHKPQMMVLMVQKEVAERICAQPGDSSRGILTVMVEFYSQAEIIELVPRENFWPAPKVDSAIIKISEIRAKKYPCDPCQFFRLVKAGFSAKRRQIHNSLAGSLRLPKNQILAILKEAKINPQLRAEDLSLDQWVKLYEEIRGII